MKKSRFTDSQIVEALKRAEAGVTVPELCRERGVSSATFYKWRGGLSGGLVGLALWSRWCTYGAPDAALH